ncbi:MAG: hypothetical protein KC443_18815 [Anaerolineales bacterium]|nr:hypothetical protein [Anaerolineales bacterium]
MGKGLDLMDVRIEPVVTPAQLQQFIRFPWQVYAHDPYWVPQLYHERLDFLDKRRNPFFAHTEAAYFIAWRGETAVGTIAALINHRHNEFHDENIAHFGLFEVLRNEETAAVALLNAACAWAKNSGADKIIGPMNLSTNDECGLLIDGFDSSPVVMMTYNPPYYVDYMTAAGFDKAMDLWAWWADIHEVAHHLPEKLLRVVNKVRERDNLHVRNLDLRHWEREVALVKRIYNSAWAKNWGFVPMTEAEFDRLAHSLRPILDPAVTFAVEKNGETVAFALSIPDVNQPLHRFHPAPNQVSSWAASAYLWRNRYHTDGLRVLVLGVIEAYRRRGIDALLYYETAKAAVQRGYKWAEASWILENNDMMNRGIAMMGAKIYKTYRIYERRL